MNQYCRYCANAYLQGDDMIWCKPKDEIRVDGQIKRLNRCKLFEFNEMDVLDIEHIYKPKPPKVIYVSQYEQSSLEGIT